MASYKKDFDYSEAIANTTDAATRTQLLKERQAKIDAEGLSGKVADNRAVSVWTDGYRPYSVAEEQKSDYTPQVEKLYTAAADAQLARFESMQSQIKSGLQSSLSQIDSDYQSAMRQTEVNARIRARAGEEARAALGINRGAAGQVATSGAAEAQRIAEDNALRGALGELGQVRLSARSAAQQAADAQLADLRNNYLQGAANLSVQQANTLLSQANADRSYALSAAGLTGFLGGMPTLGFQSYLNQVQQRRDAQAQQQNELQLSLMQQQNQMQQSLIGQQNAQAQQQYAQALQRWQTAGYVLAEDAAILGVPAGTPTANVNYQSQNLALQRWKALI